MRIDLKAQIENGLTLPVLPVGVYTGSALPLEIGAVPAKLGGGTVSGLSVTVTNADGVPVTGAAAASGGVWRALFAASNFVHYGEVKSGVKIDAHVEREDGSAAEVTVGLADLVIKPATADATPGTPSSMVMIKGSDIYFPRGAPIDGVQHYIKQVIVYDPDIGYGAEWTGDYILSADGQFVEV